MAEKPGFFGSLFDFSFTEFVTTKVIKLLYALAIFLSGLTALYLVISGFRGGAAAGVLAVLIAPLVFLFYVIAVRVWLEVIIVLFRIADHTRDIAERTKKEA